MNLDAGQAEGWFPAVCPAYIMRRVYRNGKGERNAYPNAGNFKNHNKCVSCADLVVFAVVHTGRLCFDRERQILFLSECDAALSICDDVDVGGYGGGESGRERRT